MKTQLLRFVLMVFLGLVSQLNVLNAQIAETIQSPTAIPSLPFGITSVNSGSLEERLGKLKSSMPENYPDLMKSIAQENAGDIESLIKSIRKGVACQPGPNRTSKLTKGWSEWEATDQQGTTRPYQLYIPQSVISGDQPAALVVHIHGAVGKPDFGTGAGSPSAVGYAGFLWPKVAEKNGLIIACPVGRNECAWWTDNGVSHVKAVIRDVKRTLDFPDQSIFCTGFSDGASGCYYMAMADPGPFAGFLAMNGHPEVANASGKQLYLHNMAATPFIAAMTQEDSLYPSRSVLPHITEAIRQGAPIHVISYPNANHQPVYFDDQTVTFTNFLIKTKRNVDRKSIRWLTADAKIGSVDWAEILELGQTDYDVEAPNETMVMTTPGRVSLGVQMAPSGNIVAKVMDSSAAMKAGINDGDKIVELDGTRIADTRALRLVLRKKTYGDKFTCVVERDGEKQSLTGKFPEFTPKASYSREKETSFIDCEIIPGESPMIKLMSRNVKRLRVWLPDPMTHLDTIKIVRGEQISETRVTHLSAMALLERFANNPDSAIRTSYVDIE